MGTHVCFIDIPREQSHHRHGHHSNNGSSNRLSPMSPAHSSPRYERNMGFFHQLSRRLGLKSSDDLVYAAGEDDSHSSSTDSCSSTTGTLPPMHHASTTSSATMHPGAVRDAGLHQGSSTEHLSCASSDTSSTVDINDELQLQHSGGNGTSNATNNNKRALSTLDVKPNLAAAAAAAAAAASKASSSSSRSSFTRLHRRSTSSIRRAFEGITISTRSMSCSGGSPPQSTKRSGSCSGSPAKSALKTTSTLDLHKKSTSSLFSSSSSSTSSSTGSKAKSQQPPQRILRQPVSYTYLKGMSGLPTQRVPRSAVCCSYTRR